MTAADHLLGLKLPGGWKVTQKLARSPNGTGGTFSQAYLVERDNQKGFLKAFDFWEAFEEGAETLEILQVLTAAYNHERGVLDHCQARRLSRVVVAVDHGHVQVPNFNQMEGRVYFLIFERADGDIRCQMDVLEKFDVEWSMQALKDVCLGLWQVHREMIAHQDTKPSNVLVFKDKGFKIADFGRSSRKGHSVWYDDRAIAGDRQYAPPEQLYGFRHPDFLPRRIGCDLYMLGNLAAFLFSGVNITGALLAKLDPQFHPNAWNGVYGDVLPYLQDAFTGVVDDLIPLVDDVVREDVVRLIRELCNPDLSKRGHPRGIGKHQQYSLERYVSLLENLAKRVSLTMRIRRKIA